MAFEITKKIKVPVKLESKKYRKHKYIHLYLENDRDAPYTSVLIQKYLNRWFLKKKSFKLMLEIESQRDQYHESKF